MNFSSAVMLINQNIRAVIGVYEDEKEQPNQKKHIFKTLDHSIQVGSFVVVPTDTRHKMTIVKIVAVDVDVDFESDVQLNWVISNIDLEPNKAILAQESGWIERIKEADKNKKREELKKSLLASYSGEGIENMAIAQMSDVKAIGIVSAPADGKE